jgi:hypothetical protein
MRIELAIKTPFSDAFEDGVYDSENDDVRSILVDFCRYVGRRGVFHISGFGQDPWPVDVNTDLPVLLEQLPMAIKAIAIGNVAEIDFYEQGLERAVSFVPKDAGYVISCSSQTSWRPNPSTEEMHGDRLQVMLESIVAEFVRAMRETSPTLAGHPWVLQWLAGNA